jgi:hypothetical protein
MEMRAGRKAYTTPSPSSALPLVRLVVVVVVVGVVGVADVAELPTAWLCDLLSSKRLPRMLEWVLLCAWRCSAKTALTR